ncbi:MAG: 1-acyl-sn-glycerol-3-phosphate acyltransferase [Bacteroidia bacterium]|nr:1-acyl-sn-glycerol-3-phosphate acyltransferase [Bacteroidia bacterium]
MSPKFARFVMFKLFGWRYASDSDSVIPEKKAIFLAAPHTSIWDFVIGYMYARSVGVKFKVMIKKEAFFFPFGLMLRALGGFPIDRSHPQKVLMGVMHEMEKSDTFYLCMCPEGTRKAVRKWKTGYHSIASHTGVPVYAGYYDYKKKIFAHGPSFELTDDARADTDRIQQFYKSLDLTALHPECYTAE